MWLFVADALYKFKFYFFIYHGLTFTVGTVSCQCWRSAEFTDTFNIMSSVGFLASRGHSVDGSGGRISPADGECGR